MDSKKMRLRIKKAAVTRTIRKSKQYGKQEDDIRG